MLGFVPQTRLETKPKAGFAHQLSPASSVKGGQSPPYWHQLPVSSRNNIPISFYPCTYRGEMNILTLFRHLSGKYCPISRRLFFQNFYHRDLL
jgi:hypothetical protein